ncbi:transposase [Roseiflexus castenholzii]|uniref:transposase n=1 Tax=Roseiflexus castenholzii TaxID=120962 RepID=UPI003C7DDFC9
MIRAPSPMRSTRDNTHAGGVSPLHDHGVWRPTDRRTALTGAGAERLNALRPEKAEALGVTVAGLDVLPDHGPLVVAASPTDAPQDRATPFTGDPSRVRRAAVPGLKRRRPSRWRRRSSVGSAGPVSADAIPKDIEQPTRSSVVRNAFPSRLSPTRQHDAAMRVMRETHRRRSHDALAERPQAWEPVQRSGSSGEPSGPLKATRTTDSFLAAPNVSRCQGAVRRPDPAVPAFFRRDPAEKRRALRASTAESALIPSRFRPTGMVAALTGAASLSRPSGVGRSRGIVPSTSGSRRWP